MRDIVDNLDSGGLVPAMDGNLAAFWSEYGRGEGCTLETSGASFWFYTGIDHPMFNGVPSAMFGADEVAPTLAKLQRHIDTRRAPAFWWIGPRSRPADLSGMLSEHLVRPVGEVPGMAIDLAGLDVTEPAIEGVTVRRVENANDRALWARIAAEGTGLSRAACERMEAVEASLATPTYEAQHRYLGFLHGTPVATSALVLDSGVAGIYAVATRAEARGRGLGRLLTVLPLIEARRAGYRVGILQASAMGYPIYAKLGFVDVAKYGLFMQRPASAA